MESNSRAETGSMQFEGDWTGIFIRGDNCAGYAMHLSFLIKELENHKEEFDFVDIGTIKGLLRLLTSSNENKKLNPEGTGNIQSLKTFKDCLKQNGI
jgi:hypothetical protein